MPVVSARSGSLLRTCLVLTVGLLVSAAPVWAAPASETLLPASTKAYLSVANVEQLRASWKETQLGQLADQESMKPFIDDLRAQIKEKLKTSVGDLGLSLEDLDPVVGGELAAALVAQGEALPATLVLIDVTGRDQALEEMLAKSRKRILEEGGKASQKTVSGTQFTLYDVTGIRREAPPPGEEPKSPYVKTVVHFSKDNLFCVSTSVAAAEDVLKRMSGSHADGLNQAPLYVAVMDRCRAAAGELAPQARWYVDPLGALEAFRQIRPFESEEGPDLLKVLKNQGFDAIRSVGGFVNVATGSYDLLHRTAVYAPRPYAKAMRMLELPNVKGLDPPAWIPADVAAYGAVSWDMRNAFEKFSTLFDELFGEGEEGVFEETLESIKEDPNGPNVDIKKDLIGHIGNRALVLLDYELPASPTSERTLFAAETTDEAALAATLAKSMEGDDTVTRREIHGYVVWEVKAEENLEVPTVELGSDLPLDTPEPGAADEAALKEAEERILPNSAITVAHGHILIASHVDFLERILASDAPEQPLAKDAEYLRVRDGLRDLVGSDMSMEMFRRTEDEHQVTYELLKQGKMPESQTMFGKMLNQLFQVPEGEVREREFDGSQMPEYDEVRKYLGPAGAILVSKDDGWFLTGFTLKHQ